MGVEMDGDPFPALNNTKWPAAHGGKEVVGKVTSAITRPAWAQHRLLLGAGRPRSGRHPARSRDASGGPRTATVVPMPFIDPEKTIPVS